MSPKPIVFGGGVFTPARRRTMRRLTTLAPKRERPEDFIRCRQVRLDTGEPVSTSVWVGRLPVSLNDWSRAHWSQHKAEKERWKSFIAAAAAMGQCRIHKTPVVLRIVFHYLDERGDGDNGLKHLVDGLKGRLIVDDGPRYVRRTIIDPRPFARREGVLIQLRSWDPDLQQPVAAVAGGRVVPFMPYPWRRDGAVTPITERTP